MTREQFIAKLKSDRRAAITWLAGQWFDTYDLDDLREFLVSFHLGDEGGFQPFANWDDETLIDIADDTANYD